VSFPSVLPQNKTSTHLLGLGSLGQLLLPGLFVDPPLLQKGLGNGDLLGVGGSHLFRVVDLERNESSESVAVRDDEMRVESGRLNQVEWRSGGSVGVSRRGFPRKKLKRA
jgi:hypothetical protein